MAPTGRPSRPSRGLLSQRGFSPNEEQQASSGGRHLDPRDLRELLVSVAKEAGLRVRLVHDGVPGDPDGPPGSGTCRVRDAWWVLLFAGDPFEVQLRVLASALRTHAGALLERRYLPPAVRELLDEAGDL